MRIVNALRRLTVVTSLATTALLLSACGGEQAIQVDEVDATDAAGREASAASTWDRRIPGASVAEGVFYVDSRNGNDSYTGTAPTVGSDGVGPWRSLAKVASTSFAPGNTVHLVCGSTWGQTLSLKSSGVAAKPIVIKSYPEGCTELPRISGSVQIAPEAWSRHSGSIYKAPLTSPPLALVSSSGTLTEAHHPNRGYDAAQPSSMYLRIASDSASVLVDGRAASTYLITGEDLKLPPGATLLEGTGVRIRPNAWTIDETKITSVDGNRVNFAIPTSYRLTKGWGYYFHGQLWMLDSPGEWYWDSTSKTVYLWSPDGAAPAVNVHATIRQVGVDLNSREYVDVEEIQIVRTGTGIDIRNSKEINIRGVKIFDSSEVGIKAHNGSKNSVVGNLIKRTGVSAIDGTGSDTMMIVDNVIVDAGVSMSGDRVLSLPRRTSGAVLGSGRTIISGNSITNAGYHGIFAWKQNSVTGNYIYGACSVLDDCGGIYTSNAENYSIISDNVVEHSRGNVESDPSSTVKTQAQGIYLDYYASRVTVTGNTVVDADNGIQLHIASDNIVQGNKLYGNRQSQLNLLEHTNSVRPTGDIFGNIITDNQIAPITADARGLFLLTTVQSTELFGTFDRNIYLDRVFSRVSSESTPFARTDYSFPTWQAAKFDDGSSRQLDPAGRSVAALHFAPARVIGPNIVPNGNLATSEPMWRGAYGTVTRTPCATAHCANFTSGSSEGILSTPNFSVLKDQWYRVSVDVLAGTDGQKVNMLVRRGGGGSNGYEPLGKTYFTATAGRTWQRFSFLLQATATVNAGDPFTLDRGARLDVERVQPGQAVIVTNAEIVPITSVTDATKTGLLLNTGKQPTNAACPDAATAPSMCGLYVRLSDNAPVVWPYSLAPRSGEIIYTFDPALLDSDADGIADSQDRCPGSVAGRAVNAAGCGI